MKNVVTAAVAIAILAGVVALNRYEPQRVTQQRLDEETRVEEELREAARLEYFQKKKEGTIAKTVIVENVATGDEGSEEKASDAAIRVLSFDAPKYSPLITPPDDGRAYQVSFECTHGDFVIEVYPSWAPIGAARFQEAVKAGVYNDAPFFRVLEGFMAQFGISGDPKVSAKWRDNMIKDEPVRTTNARGTLTFAKSSRPNSRTTQVFINYVDNGRLDRDGFAPFGQVVSGMDVVDAITSQYGQSADQGQVQKYGNAYLKSSFPDMDYIKKATVLSAGEQIK